MNLLSEFQLSEGRYNARDVLATARIYKPLIEAVKKFDVVKVYQFDREMAKLALQMQRVGMPIDNEERKRVGQHLGEIRDAAIAELERYTKSSDFVDWVAAFQAVKTRKGDAESGAGDLHGQSESYESAFARRVVVRKEEFEKKQAKLGAKGQSVVNFSSKVQQAAILKAAGVNLTRLTAKTGLPKISKETLETHAKNPAARAMLNYSITASVIETFVDGLEVANDGFIHPSWLIHKITGRWGSNPNVQNWSIRAGGGAENLRRMVRAPAGFAFVGADFAQLEARILAYLSRDPLLLAIFDGGRDIHAEMALIGYPTIWPTLDAHYLQHKDSACLQCLRRKKLRDMVKRLEYGAFYGGAPQILWQSVVKDVPELMLRDVENFVRAINQKLPAVMRWRQKTLQAASMEKEVRSPFLGRRETFPLGRVDPGVAYNYKAQSGGADLWAMGAWDFMQKWNQWEDNARICHNGHDSVLVLCKKELAEQVATDVDASWSRTIDGVSFPMETKIGKRWSEV